MKFKIKENFMKFWDIFKDTNTINEKSVVGFISFAIMVIYAIISIISSILGYNIPVNNTIYSSFVTITLGSFGISMIGSAASSYKKYQQPTDATPTINSPKKYKTDEEKEYDEYKKAINRE